MKQVDFVARSTERNREMSRRGLLQRAFGLTLIVLLLAGCGGATIEPTATLMPVPPTATQAPATEVPPTPEPTEQGDWFDGRIGVSLDAIEETRALPAEYEIADAREGYTYLSIYLSVTRVEGVHVVNAMGHERERPVVHGANGQSYKAAFARFTGMRVADLTNLVGSAEYVEGAEGILGFEIPQGTEITELVFLYSYKFSLDDDAPIRGEMIINLP